MQMPVNVDVGRFTMEQLARPVQLRQRFRLYCLGWQARRV